MNHQMGDLPGHIFPGLAFLAWSVIWCVVLMRRGGNAVRQPWSARADATLAADSAAAVPWEARAKIVIPLMEAAGELRWIAYPEVRSTIYSHIAADVAVIVSGVVDRLSARGKLAKGADRIGLALALLVPAGLFAAHGQHGPVATTAHRLFAGALFAAGALVLAELVRPAPIVRWARVYAVALGGVWFMHTGWILYVAEYDLMSDALVPRIYLFFSWYALGIALVLIAALSTRRRAAST